MSLTLKLPPPIKMNQNWASCLTQVTAHQIQLTKTTLGVFADFWQVPWYRETLMSKVLNALCTVFWKKCFPFVVSRVYMKRRIIRAKDYYLQQIWTPEQYLSTWVSGKFTSYPFQSEDEGTVEEQWILWDSVE